MIGVFIIMFSLQYIIEDNLSQYLTCDWTIYKMKVSKNHPYHIVSVSYFQPFQTSKTYSSKKYFQGLKKLFYDMRSILPLYRLRVYHDGSVKNQLYDFLESLSPENQSFLELFQYNIYHLREKGGLYHKGTTGTLWRFLPLMNYPLHSCQYKIILDIDSTTNHELLKLVKECDKKEDVYFMYRSHPYYYQYPRITCFNEKKSFFYYVVAHFIYQTNELSKEIFSKFLDKYIYQIHSNNLQFILQSCYPKNAPNTKNRNIYDQYQYGIDEIFMNGFYVQHQYDRNKKENKKLIVLYILSAFQYKKIIYYMMDNFEIFDIKNPAFTSFWKEFFMMIRWLKPLQKEDIYQTRNQTFDFKKLQKYMEKNETFYQHIDRFMRDSKNQSKIQSFFQKNLQFSIPNENLQKFVNILNQHQPHSFMLYPYYQKHFLQPEFIKYQNTIY
jgi:hypothetical protein